MEQGYLTPELKSYYSQELEKCKNVSNDYWRLDAGVLKVLNKINASPDFQTMFSKRTQQANNDSSSYLFLTFTKHGEDKLNRNLTTLSNLLRAKVNTNATSFSVDFVNYDEPTEMEPKNLDDELKPLDCIGNVKKYTSVNRLHLWFYSYKNKDHKHFWELLEKYLIG